MKTLGLLGGMSWESTVTYYQIINETVKQELGGLHSAKILLHSVDFAEIEAYQASGRVGQKRFSSEPRSPRIWSGQVQIIS